MGASCFLSLQLAAAAEIDEEPVSKAKQSRSEKKARKVRWDGGWAKPVCSKQPSCGQLSFASGSSMVSPSAGVFAP